MSARIESLTKISGRPERLRLPPYARDIAAARREGMVPARQEVVVLLDRWRGFDCCERVVIPHGERVESFEFGFLARIGALIAWDSSVTPIARLNDLARAILRANPCRCIAIDLATDRRAPAVFFKTVANGVEIEP